MLAKRFAALFDDPAAKTGLSHFAGGGHVSIPTFALTTTSLRHLPKWFDRLSDIAAHHIKPHGNFVSDPAAIGLVDGATSPPSLTPIGAAFLSKKTGLYGNAPRAEYELVKLLYFSGAKHSVVVRENLSSRRFQG